MAQVNGASSARLQPALRVLVRSLGWVVFGFLMIASFTSLADVPRGASADHAHPSAFMLAAACWATCIAVSRRVRAMGRVGWPFRPAVLRAVALVAVVGINAVVTWQADASRRHDVARMVAYEQQFRRIAPAENAALRAAFLRVRLPTDLRALPGCTANCLSDVLGTWSTQRDAAAVVPDLVERLETAGPTQLSKESDGTGWTITTVTAEGELRVHVRAPTSETMIIGVTMPRKPPCAPGDSPSWFLLCSPSPTVP